MKKTLLITAVIGWLAVGQSVVHAQNMATAPDHAQTNVESPVADSLVDADNYHLARMDSSQMHASSDPSQRQNSKNGMPSVPVGLAGLLVMICVLIRRRDPGG